MNGSAKGLHDPSKFESNYSNYFMVGHNAFEFLIDCGRSSPDSESVQVHTRIITSPPCAKALFELFRESIDRYESAFGAIAESE